MLLLGPNHVCLGIFVVIASLFLKSSLVYSAVDEPRKEEGIHVLNGDNFKSFVGEHEYILVEFYAPWCGHCKALAPEYVKAAQLIKEKDLNIKLAKVDATQESDLAEEHGVRGYPTLTFYVKGKKKEYGGGRTAQEIVSWLEKKLGPPVQTVSEVEELKKLVDSHDVVIVGFFKDISSSGCAAYNEAASKLDHFPYAITSSESIFKEYGINKDTVMMFRKFEEGKLEHTEPLEEGAILRFINLRSLPLVIDFNHDSAKRIFSGDITVHLLIFVSKSSGEYDGIVESARVAAKDFLEKVLFVTINTDEQDHQRMLEFFGVKKEEVPAFRLIYLDEHMAKYKPDTTEITSESMQKFVQDYLDGKLKPHLLSQTLPEDWNKKPVKTLVASIFQEVAFDKAKDVLVEFYAPWCGHCKQLVPIYEELAEKFKDNSDVVIAKIDATQNEVASPRIENFPTIILFKKDTNEQIEYNGERTLAGLTRFLESGGIYGKATTGKSEVHEEEEEEETAKHRDEL